MCSGAAGRPLSASASTRALRRPIRTLRRERGAIAVEYLALIALVVAVLASSTAIGEAISGRIVALIPGTGEGSGGGGAPDGQGGGGQSAGQGAEPAGGPARAAPSEEDDGGFLAGVGDFASGAAGAVGDFASGAADVFVTGAKGTGAFLDGLVLGDIHGSGYDTPGFEVARALGHFASGVVLVGDARDTLFNLGRVALSGGEEGKADLALSGFAFAPLVGDVAKGGKLLDGVIDTFRSVDRAGEARRAPDAPPPRRPGAACPTSSFVARTPVVMAGGGSQAIGDVEVGDRVIATDPLTRESGARAVERVIVSEGEKTLVRVRVGGEVSTATDRHPFWVEGGGRLDRR